MTDLIDDECFLKIVTILSKVVLYNIKTINMKILGDILMHILAPVLSGFCVWHDSALKTSK
jgi:hypothetical protein